MFEQVRGLCVDLERVLLVEQIDIEPLVGHPASVLQTNTNRPGRDRGRTRRRVRQGTSLHRELRLQSRAPTQSLDPTANHSDATTMRHRSMRRRRRTHDSSIRDLTSLKPRQAAQALLAPGGAPGGAPCRRRAQHQRTRRAVLDHPLDGVPGPRSRPRSRSRRDLTATLPPPVSFGSTGCLQLGSEPCRLPRDPVPLFLASRHLPSTIWLPGRPV